MHIDIKATNFELTPAIRDHVNEKIGELEKFLSDSSNVSARVEVARTTFHHNKGEVFRAEVNLSLGGKMLRAEEESGDLYAAVNRVRDELQREVQKFKEVRKTKRLRDMRLFKMWRNRS